MTGSWVPPHRRGVPAIIRCDNGPEYISETVQQ
jgi:hypothetical protein